MRLDYLSCRAECYAVRPHNRPLSPNEVSMIDRYSDHAANERTFLAWVRTGIATIAFGFVIEKFNLFILALEEANKVAPREHRLLGKVSGLLGEYDGSALILIGIALIALAALRFVRTGRLIED